MVEALIRASIGGGGAAVDDDMADGMQCSDHPYRNSSPGGICAFCLQEKLGKLVSSSSSSFFIGSSSSSSPSFRSKVPASTSSAALRLTSCGPAATSSASLPSISLSLRPASAGSASNGGGVGGSNGGRYQRHQEGGYYSRRARIPFLLHQKKKKKNLIASASSSSSSDVVLKRSKSAATPRSGRYFLSDNEISSPRRRGFWSFLHLSTHKKPDRPKVGPGPVKAMAEPAAVVADTGAKGVEYVVADEGEASSPNSCNTASFGRKVSRSRSVGCGSRSFSGDFFERISTGFGDCTLRRVESQREGRRSTSTSATRAAAGDAMKERVRCGGLFGGFIITSSSSSSSSSSYWASMVEDHHVNGRPSGPASTPGAGPLVHGRSRSWGWAFASPMRAFGKASTTTTIIKDGKRDLGIDGGSKKSNSATTAPDLAAIPSLLTVRD